LLHRTAEVQLASTSWDALSLSHTHVVFVFDNSATIWICWWWE
jgi:hypothetical protein